MLRRSVKTSPSEAKAKANKADTSASLAVIKQQQNGWFVFYTLEFSHLLAAMIPFPLRNFQREIRDYGAELLVC